MLYWNEIVYYCLQVKNNLLLFVVLIWVISNLLKLGVNTNCAKTTNSAWVCHILAYAPKTARIFLSNYFLFPKQVLIRTRNATLRLYSFVQVTFCSRKDVEPILPSSSVDNVGKSTRGWKVSNSICSYIVKWNILIGAVSASTVPRIRRWEINT